MVVQRLDAQQTEHAVAADAKLLCHLLACQILLLPCRSEVESEQVKQLVEHLKKTGRLPRKGGCPEGQLSLTTED